MAMMTLLTRTAPRPLWVFTDGAIRPGRGVSGLAAIARDERGRVLHWWSRRAGALTNNEAEYGAVILALECLARLRPRPRQIIICCDSRVVVDQAQGTATARTAGMRLALARLRPLAAQFHQVTFRHIGRERNRLADALANEAVEDWLEAT